LLGKAAELISDSIAAVRSLAVELSPPALKEASLAAALAWLADQEPKQHGLKVWLDAEPGIEGPGEEARVCLFQAVRELLFNVFKYAGVSQAGIRLSRVSDSLLVSVEDRGAGFDVAAVSGAGAPGLGLFSIRERIEALGGSMTVDSAPGSGTRVTLKVPQSTETLRRPAG
jgi:signal transduction histidine kinase